MQQRPLQTHSVFRTSSIDELRDRLARDYDAQFFDADTPNGDCEFVSCRLQWNRVGFVYCYYGGRTRVRFPGSNHVRQQFCLAGAATTTHLGESLPINPNETCIIDPNHEADVEFGPGVEQVVIEIDAGALARKRSALAGVSPNQPLQFHRSARFDDPRIQPLHRFVHFTIAELTAAKTAMPEAAIVELEQTMMVYFLLANHLNFRELLEKQARNVGPWQVRMAEEYIDANWDKPITLETLSAITGASARTIHYNFKQARGYSPMAFAKLVRLRHAREMLQQPDTTTSVTNVSEACGFYNLGHFAKDYFKAFGERPSETLAKASRRMS